MPLTCCVGRMPGSTGQRLYGSRLRQSIQLASRRCIKWRLASTIKWHLASSIHWDWTMTHASRMIQCMSSSLAGCQVAHPGLGIKVGSAVRRIPSALPSHIACPCLPVSVWPSRSGDAHLCHPTLMFGTLTVSGGIRTHVAFTASISIVHRCNCKH